MKIIYHVYGLFDPRLPKIIRYVGISKHPKIRYHQHIRDAKRVPKINTYKFNWIRKLLNDDIVPDIRLLYIFNNIEDAESKEIQLIKEYDNLTNMDPGGKLSSEEVNEKISRSNKGKLKGRCFSDETKKKMSDAKLGIKHNFYGKHHSKETKKKLRLLNLSESNPFYGKHHSKEWSNKRSIKYSGKGNPFYGRKHTDETKEKIKKSLAKYWQNKQK